MKYQIQNIEIKHVNDNPQASKYALLTLLDPDDMFNEPATVAVFNDTVINFYEKALTASQGKMEALPENAKWFPHAVWVTITLPIPMYRRWGRETTTVDKNGVPTVHQADELITDANGTPKLYTEFRVLCKETVDKERIEMGYSAKEATTWAKGWDPTSRGNSYISRFFISPTAGESTVQTAPVQQPAPQQTPAQPAIQGGQAQPVTQAPII